MIQVLYIHSRDCAACERIKPMLEGLAKQFYTSDVLFTVVDATNDPSKYLDRYGLSFIPSIVFVEKNTQKILQKIDSADDVTETQIKNILALYGFTVSEIKPDNLIISPATRFFSKNTWNIILWVLAFLLIGGLVYVGIRFRKQLFCK